jgi:hypothetical protein
VLALVLTLAVLRASLVERPALARRVLAVLYPLLAVRRARPMALAAP